MEAAFMYDAVKVYAHAADIVLKRGGDLRNGTDVVGAIIGGGGDEGGECDGGHNGTSDGAQDGSCSAKFSYMSDILGMKVHMDSSGDSEGNYILLAMVDEPGI